MRSSPSVIIYMKHSAFKIDDATIEKNIAAVKSYEKAGFTQSSQDLADYLLEEYLDLYAEGDYGAEETVTLIKTFPSTALS